MDDWADDGGVDHLKKAFDSWRSHTPHPLLDQYRFLQTHWGIASEPMTELLESMYGEQEKVRFKTE